MNLKKKKGWEKTRIEAGDAQVVLEKRNKQRFGEGFLTDLWLSTLLQ